MAVVEDIFKGVGNAVGNVAQAGAHVLFGPTKQQQALQSNTKLNERKQRLAEFELIKQDPNVSEEEKARAYDETVKFVFGDTLAKKLDAIGAYDPLFNRKQQKKAAKVEAGIKPSADTKVRAAAKKQGTTFDQLDARTKNRKSAQAFFDSATDEEGNFLNPKDEERYNKAITELDPEEVQASQQPTTNVGKRAAERTAAFEDKEFALPPGTRLGPNAERISQANLTPSPGNETSRQFQDQVQGDPRFADFFSGGTDPFQVNMQDTVPKSFADLGITSATDQEEFTQLQKALPDIDLRQEVNKSPQEYKKLFDAIRKGRITNKRAVELIKESLGQ